MSEAAENVEDLLVDGVVIEEDNLPAVTEEKHEDKPAPRGYMSKEAWVESGKDPDEWVSEEVFKERGERIKQTAKLQKEFDNQIKNLNLLHQAQLRKERENLLSRRDDAIDIADKAAVKALDKQIKEIDDLEELTQEQAVIQQDKPIEVANWENANPWINNPKDPRTGIAQKAFEAATKSGMDIDDALDLVDAAIAKKFSTKPAAPRQSVESSRPSSGKREEAVLTMKNITREERIAWDEGFFKTEKEFLQAVANSRKGAK